MQATKDDNITVADPDAGDDTKGAGSAKGSAAPPKPKCDPFASRREGC